MNAHARHVTAAKPVSIQTLARQMLDEAGGDINAAAIKLDNYASNIKRFNDEFRMLGVRTALNALAGQKRTVVLREYSLPEVKAPHRDSAGTLATRKRFIESRGGTIRSALMELTYQIGGIEKKLRDWTGDKVLAHGEAQLATARSSARNAQFLILVGRAAGTKKVGDLGDATVERLHKEAMESGE